MKLNGKRYTRNYHHSRADLMRGGRMDLDMSAEPNTRRGIGDKDRPYSFSLDKK